MYFRPISLQLEVGPEPHPKDADGSVTPAEGHWKGIAIPPRTEPQAFAFVKIDLGSCNPLVLVNRLLHSHYIQAAGYKNFAFSNHTLATSRFSRPKAGEVGQIAAKLLERTGDQYSGQSDHESAPERHHASRDSIAAVAQPGS